MTRHERLTTLRAHLVLHGHTGPTNPRLVAVDRAIAASRPWGVWYTPSMAW
jgi:hypothetical protein